MSDDSKMVQNIFGGDTGGAAPESNEPEPGNEPSGNEPGTPEPDTSPGQEPGSEPGEQGGEPGTEPEKLYAGKYKTVEELEAAYKEAERNFHGNRQELAEFKRQVDELKQMVMKSEKPGEPEDQEKNREQLLERLYDEPDTVIAELAEGIADRKVQEQLAPLMPAIQQQQINSQVQQFMSAKPDAKEYANDMAAIVQQNPELVNQPDWIERAYMQAKIARLEAAANKGGSDKAQAAAAKKAAAMPSGRKGEPSTPESEEEKTKKAIFGEPSEKRKMFDF